MRLGENNTWVDLDDISSVTKIDRDGSSIGFTIYFKSNNKPKKFKRTISMNCYENFESVTKLGNFGKFLKSCYLPESIYNKFTINHKKISFDYEQYNKDIDKVTNDLGLIQKTLVDALDKYKKERSFSNKIEFKPFYIKVKEDSLGDERKWARTRAGEIFKVIDYTEAGYFVLENNQEMKSEDLYILPAECEIIKLEK